eukprot:1432609-Rhodomonas_salina.8
MASTGRYRISARSEWICACLPAVSSALDSSPNVSATTAGSANSPGHADHQNLSARAHTTPDLTHLGRAHTTTTSADNTRRHATRTHKTLPRQDKRERATHHAGGERVERGALPLLRRQLALRLAQQRPVVPNVGARKPRQPLAVPLRLRLQRDPRCPLSRRELARSAGLGVGDVKRVLGAFRGFERGRRRDADALAGRLRPVQRTGLVHNLPAARPGSVSAFLTRARRCLTKPKSTSGSAIRQLTWFVSSFASALGSLGSAPE